MTREGHAIKIFKDVNIKLIRYNGLDGTYEWPINKSSTISNNILDALFGRHEINIKLTMVRNKLYATYTWKDNFKE